MPNMCSNYLSIRGSEKDIKRFKKRASSNSSILSLNKLVPMPKALEGTTSPTRKKNKDLIKKYGADNWYDWHVNNWGTKWDVQAELEYEWKSCLVYSFSSAWAPPIRFLKKVSEIFPNLTFRLKYEEDDLGYMGIAKVSNGEVEDKNIRY